ncbi:MAG: Flp pilus assembly complex ATPase component TadA, partial [Xanthomonadales bacterium]|nr:Flp pilus assembly complex ATPase component TadA [Xanthomonadales bacterium]
MASNPQTTTLTGLTGVARRLVTDGALSEADARKASEASSKQRVSLIAYLIENGLADPKVTAAAASQEFGVPLFDASTIDLKQAPVKAIEQSLIEKHRAVPLYKRGNRMFIGIADPTNDRALEEIKFQSKTLVEPIIVDDNTLTRLIEQALSQSDTVTEGMDDTEGLENLETQGGDDEGEGGGSGVDVQGNDDTPVVRFINKVLVDAIKRGASDIHFEPYETAYRVRFRMDGILRQVASAPVKLSARMAARLKVMSALDIAERRVPQDGRIKLNLSKTKAVDFRVST